MKQKRNLKRRKMKEHVEFITDSFTDYAGKVHHFVIAALSQSLPTRTGELEQSPIGNYNNRVIYEVGEYIEDYGTEQYLGNVTKVLRLGISICNPTDAFNEKVGARKAIARAHNAEPSLYAANPGIINTGVVKALLKQEAQYLKNNPENFIPGYLEMRDRYLTRQKMETMKKGFTELENQVVEGLEKDSKFLDNAMEYLKWVSRKRKGTGCQK